MTKVLGARRTRPDARVPSRARRAGLRRPAGGVLRSGSASSCRSSCATRSRCGCCSPAARRRGRRVRGVPPQREVGARASQRHRSEAWAVVGEPRDPARAAATPRGLRPGLERQARHRRGRGPAAALGRRATRHRRYRDLRQPVDPAGGPARGADGPHLERTVRRGARRGRPGRPVEPGPLAAARRRVRHRDRRADDGRRPTSGCPVEALGAAYLGGANLLGLARAGLVTEQRPGAARELWHALRSDVAPSAAVGSIATRVELRDRPRSSDRARLAWRRAVRPVPRPGSRHRPPQRPPPAGGRRAAVRRHRHRGRARRSRWPGSRRLDPLPAGAGLHRRPRRQGRAGGVRPAARVRRAGGRGDGRRRWSG